MKITITNINGSDVYRLLGIKSLVFIDFPKGTILKFNDSLTYICNQNNGYDIPEVLVYSIDEGIYVGNYYVQTMSLRHIFFSNNGIPHINYVRHFEIELNDTIEVYECTLSGHYPLNCHEAYNHVIKSNDISDGISPDLQGDIRSSSIVPEMKNRGYRIIICSSPFVL